MLGMACYCEEHLDLEEGIGVHEYNQVAGGARLTLERAYHDRSERVAIAFLVVRTETRPSGLRKRVQSPGCRPKRPLALGFQGHHRPLGKSPFSRPSLSIVLQRLTFWLF